MSDMVVYRDIEQGTPEWFDIRKGIPTASKFSTILASGKDGGASLTRAKYLRELAAEIITGDPTESYSNGFMERGHAQESDARDLYVFLTENSPQRVGFVRSGSKGCSPDSLIGDDGALEIKTMKGDLLIEVILKDKFPAAHVAQCQGVLWVAEREWIDIAVYTPKLPLFVKRAYRDESYISNLSRAVDQFNDELAALVERVRAYGGSP